MTSLPGAPTPSTTLPKVWFIPTLTPLSLHLTHHALSQNHRVTLCLPRRLMHSPPPNLPSSPNLLLTEHDPSHSSTLHSALATHLQKWGVLTILLLPGRTKTLFGALDTLAEHAVTAAFEDGFFAAAATVRAVLPVMRRQRFGHVIAVTGMGTEGCAGLGIAAAADHAVEGLVDAVAYEVAPFGVRCTVVQAGDGVVGGEEVELGTGIGEVMQRVQKVVEGLKEGVDEEQVKDVVRVVMEIAGLENPPGRITVGVEEGEAVRERLKVVSEELEEFLEASMKADVPAGSLDPER